MTGFTKLFQDIVTSTIWREPDTTRIVWVTMLALADREGLVSASVPGLAAMANVSMDKTVEALKTLKAPDEWSRSKEHEGRRIKEVDGGWLILNHAKYRDKLSAEERRKYLAEKQAEYRAKKKAEMETEKEESDVNEELPSDGKVHSKGFKAYGGKKTGRGWKTPKIALQESEEGPL